MIRVRWWTNVNEQCTNFQMYKCRVSPSIECVLLEQILCSVSCESEVGVARCHPYRSGGPQAQLCRFQLVTTSELQWLKIKSACKLNGVILCSTFIPRPKTSWRRWCTVCLPVCLVGERNSNHNYGKCNCLCFLRLILEISISSRYKPTLLFVLLRSSRFGYLQKQEGVTATWIFSTGSQLTWTSGPLLPLPPTTSGTLTLIIILRFFWTIILRLQCS